MSDQKQSIQISFILFLLVFLLLALMVTSAQDGLKEKIKKAKTFEDIFQLEKTINLETPKEYFISIIMDLVLSNNGDLILRMDGAGASKILVFDQEGKFKTSLGKNGHSDDEYLSPWSIAKDSRDNIYVYDQPKRKILVYDLNNNLIKTLPKLNSSLFIHINSKDDIFMYMGINAPEKFNCIVKYNQDGKRITEFAELPDEIKKVKFYAIGNTMQIDKKNFVYEVNPLWSNVRKYNSDGIFLTEFGSKKVRDYTNADKIGVEKISPRIIESLIIFRDYLLLIYNDDKMDVYDLDGEVINKNIKISNRILFSSDTELYVTALGHGSNSKILKYVIND